MRRRIHGFTLVEMLIVLVLTSVLTVALFSTFRTGAASWQTAERHIDRIEGVRQLLSVLQRHLLHVQSLPLVLPDGPEFAFAGNEESIRYVAPLSMSAGNELYFVELYNDGFDGGVWGRFVPYSNEDMSQTLSETEPVQISADSQLRFEYYGRLIIATSFDRDFGWTSYWTEKTEFPTLVKVSVDGPRGRIPDLIYRVGRN